MRNLTGAKAIPSFVDSQGKRRTFMTRLWEEIQDIGASACTQLFESYGVPLARESGQVTLQSRMRYCGVIHFRGENIHGTIGLATPQDILGQSDPARIGARDWVGELANQLAGRLKNRLLARSVEVCYSTPVILRGEQLSLEANGPVETVWFRSEMGSQVGFWIDLDLADRFQMSEESDEEKAGLPEGDFLLF
jgi:hypothetical protein